MTAIFKTNHFSLNKTNNYAYEKPMFVSNDNATRRSLTNEETENLAGMVANRRALFENNSGANTTQARHVHTRPLSQGPIKTAKSTFETPIDTNQRPHFLNQPIKTISCKLQISSLGITLENFSQYTYFFNLFFLT